LQYPLTRSPLFVQAANVLRHADASGIKGQNGINDMSSSATGGHGGLSFLK